MSKLYKELKYDTDRVMQPGDPLTSANGKNEVVIGNDGVAAVHHLPTYYLIDNVPNMGSGVAKLYFRSIESIDEIESGLDEIHAEVEVLFGSSSSLPSFSRRELTFTRNQGSGSGDYSCDLSSLSSGYSMFLYGPWCGGSPSYDGIGYQTGGSSFFWETTGGHIFKDLYTDEKRSDIVVNGGFFCSDGENTKLKITDDNGAVLYKKSFGGPVVHLKAGWNVGGYTTAVDQDIEFKGPFVGGGPAEYYYVPVDYAGSTGDEDFLTNAWKDGPFLLWKLNGGRIEFTYGQYGAKEITIFDPTNLNNEEVLPLTSSNVPTGQFSITRSISYSPAILATTDQLLQIGTTSTTAAAGDHTHNTLVSQDSKVTVTTTNDGTLTINKPGVPLTDNDTLASLATILGLPDTASLSDVQQALGLPDTATLADAMAAAATPINTRFATIDELPEVPIKAVKQNGTALTPDSDGAVNIEVSVDTGSYSLTTPEQTTSTTTTTNDTITVQLSDKAINAVQVPTTVTNVVMKFPQQETGKARDFMVRLIVTGETVPSITLTEPDGSAIDFDVDDDSWTEIQKGVNLLMFTETAQ